MLSCYHAFPPFFLAVIGLGPIHVAPEHKRLFFLVVQASGAQ